MFLSTLGWSKVQIKLIVFSLDQCWLPHYPVYGSKKVVSAERGYTRKLGVDSYIRSIEVLYCFNVLFSGHSVTTQLA